MAQHTAHSTQYTINESNLTQSKICARVAQMIRRSFRLLVSRPRTTTTKTTAMLRRTNQYPGAVIVVVVTRAPSQRKACESVIIRSPSLCIDTKRDLASSCCSDLLGGQLAERENAEHLSLLLCLTFPQNPIFQLQTVSQLARDLHATNRIRSDQIASVGSWSRRSMKLLAPLY